MFIVFWYIVSFAFEDKKPWQQAEESYPNVGRVIQRQVEHLVGIVYLIQIATVLKLVFSSQLLKVSLTAVHLSAQGDARVISKWHNDLF